MKRTLWLLCCCLLSLTFNRTGLAQTPSPPPVALEKAVDTALTNYPEIRAARARKDAAKAGIQVAKTSYLPRTDLL